MSDPEWNVNKIAIRLPVTDEMMMGNFWRAYQANLRYELREHFLDETDGPRYGPARPPRLKGKPRVVTYWKGRYHDRDNRW